MIIQRDSRGRIEGVISLYDWCIDNNRKDIIDLWDYTLNTITPKDISFSSSKDYYFKCPLKKHKSEQKKITYLTNSNTFKCNCCNSFAQHVIDKYGEDLYYRIWSKDNKKDGFDIPYKSNKKIILLSYKSQTSYETAPCAFWEIKDIYNYAGKNIIEDDLTLGRCYPKSISVWSNANFLSPYDYSYGSNDIIIWKCQNKIHDEYCRKVRDSVVANFNCPQCSLHDKISNYEKTIYSYLKNDLHYNVLTEYDCNILPKNPSTNRWLPYDNEVVELKLIIEVHGKQHYEVTGFTQLRAKQINKTYDEVLDYRKQIDQYKKQYAINKGYHYLEVPYWAIDNGTYRVLIDKKISDISGNEVV